ncbi:P-loop containing nucleoside triphosphate hydrolase protein [Hyaloraphidium curvatum]|nr:P-loop containing nucleoside triphosphate hydrolase protein [Hyaloraphidium curvatum]
MSKILKSLHGEEVEAAMKRKVPPPVPSIPDLNKAFRLRHLVSLARCNAIPPPLDPVQHLVVDTSRNLRDLLQPLPPPAVETPTDFASLFRFYGKKFEHKDFAHLPLDAVERRVVQVLGMAMRRAVGWALEPRRKHVVDFDDLIYLPVLVRGVKFPRLKFVFVDEAQDLSLMRIELVRRCLDQGGRLVAVGDRHQSIYAWAGSLPNSLDHLPHSFGALTRFDLPITWRCPALHVEATMQMANLLQRPVRLDARPGAARGALEYRPGIWDIDSPDAGQAAAAIFRPGDLVLARLNQPLKLLAWKLGEWGIPHTCSAVNVGSRLAAFLRKHGAAVPRFPDPYHEGSAVPLAELRAIAAAKVTDKPLDPGSLLVRIIDRLLASATGPGPAVGHALFEELHRLYPALSPGHSPGAAGAAHLSTVHKAKGLERARVVIVQPWDCPFFPRGERGAMQWEREQEANLIYVALTRSKAELLLVDINCGPLSWKYGKLDWLHKKNSEAFRRAFGGAEARVPRVAAPTPAAVHVAPVQAAPATPVKRKNQLQEPTPAAVHIAPTAPVQAVPATPVKRKNQPQEPTPASTTPPSKKQRPPPRTPETPTRARRAIRADSDDEVGMSDGNEGMSDGDFSVGQKSPRKKGSQRGRGKGGRGGRKK